MDRVVREGGFISGMLLLRCDNPDTHGYINYGPFRILEIIASYEIQS